MGKKGIDGALTNVITSLDKLVDLERRISKLETNQNEVPDLDGEAPAPQVVFNKKRTSASINQPAKTTYSVTLGQRSTQLPSLEQKQRQREATLKLKKARALRDKNESTRQDGIIKDWLKTKKDKTLARKSRLQARSQAVAEKQHNINAQVQAAPSKPQRLQQFHEIRREFEKRKEELYRELKTGQMPTKEARGRTKTRAPGGPVPRSKTVNLGSAKVGTSNGKKAAGGMRRGMTVPPQRSSNSTSRNTAGLAVVTRGQGAASSRIGAISKSGEKVSITVSRMKGHDYNDYSSRGPTKLPVIDNRKGKGRSAW